MIKYRIYLEYDGYEESMDLQGTTIEEIRERAMAEVERRKPVSYWSQRIAGPSESE